MLARHLVYYRSSASGVDDSTPTDSEELVKDCPTGCAPIVKKQRVLAESPSYFSTADVDAALQLMSHQGLTELQNAYWSAFSGKKRSWQHLAVDVLNRLARDIIQLRDIKRVR